MGRELSLDSNVYKHWSVSAYECYKRNCVCDDCPNLWYCRTYGQRNSYGMPHMKFTVLKLFENLGQEGLEKFEDKLKRGTHAKPAGHTKY